MMNRNRKTSTRRELKFGGGDPPLLGFPCSCIHQALSLSGSLQNLTLMKGLDPLKHN